MNLLIFCHTFFRYGTLSDPFGRQWGIATYQEDVAPEEMKRRQDAFFSKAAGQN